MNSPESSDPPSKKTPTPQMESPLLEELCGVLAGYIEPPAIEMVRKAYEFGAMAHEGQFRISGEPYINHPLAVALILAGMGLNAECIIAAILHDVIEDTPVSKEQIANLFGDEVAELVDGVSKLTKIHFESRVEAQAENFRKMFLAMVEDIRVIIIKLADRLHNMRTLGAIRPDKQRRISRETLEIYAPIANRLGMNAIRIELQDLGFRASYPLRYRVLSDAVRKARGNRKEIVSKIESAIEQRMSEYGIKAKIIGREKHLYSLYEKMRVKHLSFSEVTDVYAFRVIVDSVDTCYRFLGVVHNLYKPVPGKFKDYIALPKANGYQSLHTVLFGPYSVPIEVQVRSVDMDKVAEAGVAAHWVYKTGEDGGSSKTQNRAREWMRDLLDIQKNAGNSIEFLENVKIDLFPDVVYVFTPQGKIMELKRGSTAVDFAYAVHTDVGNQCIAVKIDRQLSPLSVPLFNGQTVEIVTSPVSRPNPNWLNFVVTGKARTTIRNYLKDLKVDDAVALGKRMLAQALQSYSMTLEQIIEGYRDAILVEFTRKSVDKIYEEIGLGRRPAFLVAKRLIELHEKTIGSRKGSSLKSVLTRYMPSWLGRRRNTPGLAILGTEGMTVSYAKCCHPIPGDPIIGFVTAGRGIVIHNESCKNISNERREPKKLIDVQWEESVEGEFPVDIRIDVINRRGMLATLAAAISEMDSNIDNVGFVERDSKYSIIIFTITVHSRIHLANIMRHVRPIEGVSRINRKKA